MIIGSGILFFAAKINANFPDNPRQHGLPTIQGMTVAIERGVGVEIDFTPSA
jgi:ornithine cyclodeaminase/alanine dehydrogenase-like protein (mu-crystallin family)